MLVKHVKAGCWLGRRLVFIFPIVHHYVVFFVRAQNVISLFKMWLDDLMNEIGTANRNSCLRYYFYLLYVKSVAATIEAIDSRYGGDIIETTTNNNSLFEIIGTDLDVGHVCNETIQNAHRSRREQTSNDRFKPLATQISIVSSFSRYNFNVHIYSYIASFSNNVC